MGIRAHGICGGGRGREWVPPEASPEDVRTLMGLGKEGPRQGGAQGSSSAGLECHCAP